MIFDLIDRRATKVAASTVGNPTQWLVDLFSGTDTVAGPTVNERNAMQFPAVYAAVRVLAESVAQLPLVLYRRKGRGKEAAREHDLYGVLHDQPNPDMTAFSFRETLMGHLLLWGNCYAEVVKNGAGRVVGLWPIRPDRVKPERYDDGKVYYEIDQTVGSQIVVPGHRIFHIPGLSFNGVYGFSPVSMARDAIGLGLAAEDYGSSFFGNSARPSGILSHPAKLDDDAVKRIRESWERIHQGADKANKIAVLEEGMGWQQVGIPPEDAQFLETRKYQVEEIARIFRIPPHMIADLSKATYSNIESQQLSFVQDSLQPWLIRWEQEIARKLLTDKERGEYFAEHKLEGRLRGDTESRFKAYATARQWGWMSVNDIRELENMNPVESGDIYLQPMNMVEAGEIPVVDLTEPATEEPANTDPMRSDTPAVERRSFEGRVELRDRFLKLIEEKMRFVVGKEASRLRFAVDKILRAKSRQEFINWVDEFFADEHIEWTQDQVRELLTTFISLAAAEAALELGKVASRDMVEDITKTYIQEFSARHAGISRGQVEARMREFLDDTELASALEELADSWEERRPGKIAMTESVMAMGKATVAVFAALGVRKMIWRNTGGEDCPLCNRMNGRVVEVGSPFLQPGERVRGDENTPDLVNQKILNHPPLHRGCDCVVVAEY